MRPIPSLRALLFAALLASGFVARTNAAVDDTATTATTAAPGATASESAAVNDPQLAAFIAGAVEAQRTRTHIAGVIVSVVKDDRLLFSGGFGNASIEPQRAANGDETLFRIGSISKTFTYTAAMQLVEQGLIKLDDPVNQHLPDALKVPDEGYSQPIRVRDLFTHTAGFEDSALGHLFVRDGDKDPTLDDYVAHHRPHRVRPPGTVAVYSNYSLALLGALIAHKAGMSFEELIESRLTGPLGMHHSSFREPHGNTDPRALAPNLAASIATGYERKNGAFVPGWFEYIGHGAPAGAVSATASDMARWMRMHLNEGELDGVRVLKAETALKMREILFRDAPDIDGVAHGFLTEHYGRYFAYGHGGATLYFHSDMVMVPELRLGVFVSANTDNARAPMRELARTIIEHLVPDAAPQPKPIALSQTELAQYAGNYRSNRRPYYGAEKLLLAADGDAEVSVGDDGTLRVSANDDTTRYLPIGPRLFQDAESNARLQFLTDAQGRVSGYAYGFGVSVSEKIGPLETANALLLLLALSALITVRRLWCSLRSTPEIALTRPDAALVKTLAIIDALAWLAFFTAAVVAASGMLAEGRDVIHTYPSSAFKTALLLATIAALCTALEVLALIPAWRSAWNLWPKIRHTLAVALLALTVYAMWGWNLIGMKT